MHTVYYFLDELVAREDDVKVREAMKKAFKAAEENFQTTQSKIKNEVLELKRLLKRERVVKRPEYQYISSYHNPNHMNSYHRDKVHDQNIPLAALSPAMFVPVPPAQNSQSYQYQY